MNPHDETDEDTQAAAHEHRATESYQSIRSEYGGCSELSERIAALRRNFPEINPNMAEEILDFMADEGWLTGRSRKLEMNLPKWMGKFVQILRYIKNHPNSTAIYAVIHIWDEPLLDDINQHQTQEQFSKAIGLTKAAVNNAVMDAQRHFRLEPRRDQRKEDARQKMTEARINQLAN